MVLEGSPGVKDQDMNPKGESRKRQRTRKVQVS